MSYYSEEDLRDFEKYAKEFVRTVDKEKHEKEEIDKVKDLIKIIVTLRYNAMVFESFIMGHSANDYILSKELNNLPLHINDDGLLSQVIIKWRLERNK